MRRLAGLLLLVAVAGQALCAQAKAGETPIFVATDIHYLAPELHDEGPAFQGMVQGGDGKDTGHCEELLEALEHELPKPSILLVTGDLTLNGEEASHRALARRFEAFRKAGIRVFVLPGNHDLDNPWASEYRGSARRRVGSVSAKRFREIYRDCGYDAALSKDGASLGYLVQLDRGTVALMLDSTEHELNLDQGYPSPGGRLSEATLGWIDRVMGEARSSGQNVIVAMHHSLIDHNSMLGEGYTLENAEELVAILQRHRQPYALSGHIHIQSIAKRSAALGDLFDIATGSLAVYPNNYGALRLDRSSGQVLYETRRLDVAAWARAKGLADPYLREYAKYSADYFGGFARRLVDKFGVAEGLSKAEQESLLDFMAELNLGFFAGTIDAPARKELLDSAGYKAAQKLHGTFLAGYVESVLAPPTPDNNRLSIPYD
jgi:3',5'-cyclic AMP phosphodiesterase CpdA